MKKFLLLTLFAVLLTPWTVKAEILTFDFEDGQVPSAWVNDKTYPWVVVNASQGSGHTGTYCLKSGNGGVNNSSSSIEATFTFVGDGSISFLGGCWGEGSSTAWDKCIFYIDGVQQFAYGARDTWETYTFEVEAGDHTFKWEFTKDSSVAGTGDAFFIDDVVVDLGSAAACPKPLSIAASNISAHEATITWADGGGTYNVEYKKASDTIWTAALSNSTLLSTTISNLAPLTNYQMRVQSVCGSDVSGWKNGEFITAAGIPFVGNFSGSSMPTEWSRYSGLLSNVQKGIDSLTVTTSGWGNAAANGVFGTEKHLKINIYGNSCKYWIVTPSMEMEDNVQLSFDLALTKYSGTLQAVDKTQQADDKFAVLITTDGGTSWQVLRQWDNAGSEYVYNDINCSVNGEAVAIDLSSYNGQTIAIALYGESTETGNGDNNLHIGNFKIDYIPSCFKPVDVAANAITTSSASISWTSNGNESDWMIQYKKAGAAVWTTIGANTNPFTLQNLDPASVYEVQVAAWCDVTDSTAISEFSRAISIITECEAVTSFPWAESFDSITAGANVLPLCWSAINTTTNSTYKVYPRVYENSYSIYSHSAPNCLYLYSYAYYSSGTTSSDPQPQYAILPEMDGIDNLQITLWAKGNNANASFKIGRMSNPADTTTFQQIAEQALTTSYKEYTFNLAGAAGAYIAIKIDAASQSRTTIGAYIDDISVHEAPSCTKPSALAVSEVKSHSAKLRWIPGSDEDAWQIMLNGDAEHLIAADSNVFVLTNLPADSMFVVKVRSNCGSSQSEWANDSVIFTTLVACPAPEFGNDSVKNVMAHTANLTWGGDAESYIVSYRIPAYLSGFSEDFEGEFDGWTLRNCAASTGVSTGDHHSGSKSFRFYYNTNPPQYLISPMLSLAAGDSLRFWYKNHSTNYPETFQVGYSSTDDANDSFVFGEELTASDTQWHQFVELIPAGTKYICWKYNSNDMFYLYIDDVEIGEVIPAGEWTVQSGITANGIQLTGLAAETKYEVTVQANCGGEDGTSLIPSATFKTISDCQTPSALAADSLTTSSAVISWETYGLENFNLRYGTEGENWTVVTGISMPYTLTGLSAGTEYQVQVQAACNTEAWSAVSYFKTVYAIPFAPVAIEADEWYGKSGLAADIFAGAGFLSNSSTWSVTAANEVYDTTQLVINNYGTGKKDWAISPEIDATALQLADGEKLELSFTLAMAKWNSSHNLTQEPDTTGIDDKFIVAFSIDNGATWSAANATVWDNQGSANIYNSIPMTGVDVQIDMSAAAGHVMRFAFYAESTESNADNDIHVGDVVLNVVGNATDIRAIEATGKAFKFVENGQIYIRFNGVTYDALGRLVRK